MTTGKIARIGVEEKADDAEQKIKEADENFPTLRDERINEHINSYADEVVQLLVKEFQAGYDFILNRLNLPTNHEPMVVVQRPKEPEAEEEEEEKVTEKFQTNDVTNDPPSLELLLEGQISDGGLVENNAPTIDVEILIGFKAACNTLV